MKLRDVQAAALVDAYAARGLMGLLGVGSGKTLVSLLLPTVLDAKRPLLLVPASIKKVLLDDTLPALKEHWKIREDIRIESYNALSRTTGAGLLGDYEPDVIIADECHFLRSRTTARTRRFMRYFREKPDTMFVGLSGTIVNNSLMDYWHLFILALGVGVPLPRGWPDARDWAMALDEDVPPGDRIRPGALAAFCAPGEALLEGYRRRLVDTPGVISPDTNAIGASLIIRRRSLPRPEIINEHLKRLREEWVTPGGEEITDAVDYWRKCQEVALGFYYEWDWEGRDPDIEWLSARSAWRSYVRHVIRRGMKSGGHHIDSELQVYNACSSGRLQTGGVYEAWASVRHKKPPLTVPRWFTHEVIKQIPRLIKTPATLVWVSQNAVAEALQKHTGWPYFGAGDKNSRQLMTFIDTAKTPGILSIQSHGTGKNLQRYSNNLVVSCPASGACWEQLLGRTHRSGQRADEVNFDVLLHTQELKQMFEKAIGKAGYIESSTGQQQKLCYAQIV